MHDCNQCVIAGVCSRHPKINKKGVFGRICRGEYDPAVRDKWIDQWDTEEFGKPLEPRRKVRSPHRRPHSRGGVGAELRELLPWFGQREGTGCNFRMRATQMDGRGIVWCEQNVDMIVRWVQEAAKKRPILAESLELMPGLEMTAHDFVQRAIENAKQKHAARMTRGTNPFSYAAIELPRFITKQQLMIDAHALASMLPPDTPFIIGVARSGLCVATMVAMLLHLPLKIFRQSTGDLIDAGNGWRLTGNTGGQGSPVVIDDTVMTGNSFKHSMPTIRRTFPGAISAAVYVNPKARVKPEIWVTDLPWPHLLEWNLFNSVLSPSIAYDFDGILCHDCPHGSDDDGPRYADFLRDTKPLYVIRKTQIALIVTARLEKYRPQTMEWLARHGIAVNQLVMGPWRNNHERARSDVAAYKAEHYRRFLTLRHRIKPAMFVESDVHQATRISEFSGGLVVCPAAGRCF
jgi:hypothetical protein